MTGDAAPLLAGETASGAATALPPGPGFGHQVAVLGLAFAATLFLVSSTVWAIVGIDPVATALAKLIGIAGDAALAALITLVLWWLSEWRLGVKALLACALSLAAAPVSALIDRGLQLYFMAPQRPPFDPQYFAQVVVFTTSELFGWSCLYLALQYSHQTRQAERRLSLMRQQATEAQLRALQYQVNPHFLFNTLNSVAALIEERDIEPARDMVLQLAGFLRQTLALDPLTDIALRDEIALQRAYLSIEERRFSDRMVVRQEIAPDAEATRVPALILQPLVENAIKHGVARTPGQALIVIGAERDDKGRLRIWVDNSLPPEETVPAEGLGIGLSNVVDRLAARYGTGARCYVRRMGGDMLRSEIILPLRP